MEKKVINFYSTKDAYGCFSNFSRHHLFLKNKIWRTSEHYFQAQKFLESIWIFFDLESRLTSNTPNEHFNLDIDDNDSYVMLFQLLQFFQMLEREQKAQNNGNMYFSKDLNA